MIKEYNITNAQVLDFINKRLYEIQNGLGSINIDKPKNKKWKIIAQLGSYALFIIGVCFFAAAFLGPAGLSNILFSKLITALVFAGLGGTSLGISQAFDLKLYKGEKQEASFNSEAITLQQVREYLNGKLAVTKEIQKSLDSIKCQIYDNEQTQYRENSQQTIASSNIADYSNPQAIETPFVVQGVDMLTFAKQEYSRLKVEEFSGDCYYFIGAIDNGKYNNIYNQAVLSELRNLAVKDIAKRFYETRSTTYAETPDIIISDVRRGIYNDKHSKEVLAEVINIATYYKNSKIIKKAV